jgi:hypothetical protein
MGPMGLQGPAGPTEGWVDRNAATQAVTTTQVTVASLSLPAGDYLLLGKLVMVRVSGSGYSECQLLEGSTVLDQAQATNSSNGAVLTAHGYVSLSATTTINLRCRITSGSANASQRTLSAVRFSTLTLQ